MASMRFKSEKRDLTTCSICFETFKTPKHFPCLHSFCEGCIASYITATIGRVKGGVNCPVCRMFVAKPDHISVAEWAKKLPTNHILVSLIDTNKPRGGQKLCAACVRENETANACSWCVNCSEALCKDCARYHRKNKTSSNHKQVGLNGDSSTNVQLHHAEYMCTYHPEKKLEAYCNDHSAICCMTCVMLQHRKCENVCSVEDAAERKKKSKEVANFEGYLQDVKQTLESLVQDRVENLEHFDATMSEITTDIDSLFQELSDHLSQLRTNIMSEISRIKKEVRPEIEDTRYELNNKLSVVENDLALFHNNMKHALPAYLLQAMANLSDQRSELETFLRNHSRKIREIKVTYEANEKLLEINKVIKEFGRVNISRTVKEVFRYADTHGDMLSVVPSLTADVNTGFKVTGIALLENGRVLVSDWENDILQLRDPRCSVVLFTLSLAGGPYGIKMTSDSEGALVVEGKGLIIFKVENDRIVTITEIRTDVNHDFVYHKGKYHIGCYKKVAVYDSKHRKVRDIAVGNNVDYLAVRDDTSLCYTVYMGRGLYCITMDGTLVFMYSHETLQHTIGVTVDHAGFIYVCSYGSKNVHQLSHDGKLQRIIFENLPARPYSISINAKGNKAVIGSSGKILLYNL